MINKSDDLIVSQSKNSLLSYLFCSEMGILWKNI